MSFDVPVLVEAAGFDTALQFFEIEAGRSFREKAVCPLFSTD
jgi:hypothetical protein